MSQKQKARTGRALCNTWGADSSTCPVCNRQDCQLNGGNEGQIQEAQREDQPANSNDHCERPKYFHSILAVTESILRINGL